MDCGSIEYFEADGVSPAAGPLRSAGGSAGGAALLED